MLNALRILSPCVIGGIGLIGGMRVVTRAKKFVLLPYVESNKPNVLAVSGWERKVYADFSVKKRRREGESRDK